MSRKSVKATTSAPEQIKLRDYQADAVDRVLDCWRKGQESVALVLPVGGGKTLTAAHVVKRVVDSTERGESDFDVYFLAHRLELIEQPSRAFRRFGIHHGVIKAGVPSTSARVQIASVQTLARRDVSVLNDSPTRSCLIIPDELHRYKAQDHQRVIRELRRTYAQTYLVGLTATPYRLDGQGLGDVCDALVEGATTPQLIAGGYITEGTVIGRPPPKGPDRRAIDENTGELLDSEVESVMDQPKLVGDAVDTWRRHCDGYPGIGRCSTKRSAMLRLEKFAAAGFRVGYLDGETLKRERQLLLARLAIGGERSAHPLGLDVLLFVNVLTEGYDSESSYGLVLDECRRELWPRASAPPPYVPLCVVADYAPTESMGAFIQLWGRGSRTHPDKPWLKLLSHAGNEDRHCFLSQHHGFTLEHKQGDWIRALREREADQAVPTASGSGIARLVCQECNTRWLPGTEQCLHCGSTDLGEVSRREVYGDSSGEEPEEVPGELVAKTADAEAPRPPTPYELERWFDSQFRKLREENAQRLSDGKTAMKPGTLWFRFKGIYKRPPPPDVWRRYLNTYGYGK